MDTQRAVVWGQWAEDSEKWETWPWPSAPQYCRKNEAGSCKPIRPQELMSFR